MTGEDRDFRNCGWAGRTKNLAEDYFCNRKRLHLREADLNIGICPCLFWVHPSKGGYKYGTAGKKKGPEAPTLIREPEKKA